MGLYINELNMYDGSRDMVMAGWQHASKLESLIEQVIEFAVIVPLNLRLVMCVPKCNCLFSIEPICERLKCHHSMIHQLQMWSAFHSQKVKID